jgi:hypothetical protein
LKITVPELVQTIPTPIKVGTLTYTVETFFPLKDPETNEEVAGLCVFDTQTIKVNGIAASNEYVVDTVLHELLHAVWSERGLPKTPKEERAVKALGTGLVALFQDNPKLLAWVKKGLSRR